MRPSYKRVLRMNNSVDGATSSPFWGKKPYKKYRGVAGKGGKTVNFEIKDKDKERD